MPQASEHGLFSLLPQRRPPWREFVLSTGVQGLVVLFAVWILMLRPQVLIPTSDYHYVELVSTPPPVNHVPAPVRASQPAPVVAEVKLPLPETVPPVEVQLATETGTPSGLVQEAVRLTGPPATTLAGLADKETVGGFFGGSGLIV